MRYRRAAVVAAVALDLAAGEIGGSLHPVVATGRVLDFAYRPWRRRGKAAELLGGAVGLAVAVSIVASAAAIVERAAGRLGAAGWLPLALGLKPMFALRQLLVEAAGVARDLEVGRLEPARQRLRALVSRPTEGLEAPLVASAAIESVAENLADSVVAPLLYFRLFGLPGAAAYRVVNTADAMFGYRGETEWLGKVAARSDDILGWLPSRLAAVALALAGHRVRTLPSVWRDGRLTTSPNAGRPMAAMAWALGRRLEKPGHHVLAAQLPAPGAGDIRRALKTGGVAAALVVLVSAAPVPRRVR